MNLQSTGAVNWSINMEVVYIPCGIVQLATACWIVCCKRRGVSLTVIIL